MRKSSVWAALLAGALVAAFYVRGHVQKVVAPATVVASQQTAATEIGGPAPDAQQPLDVSIVQLLANPSAFDGKLIRVTGFLRLEFEHTVIYLYKEDSDHGLNSNGIWVELGDGAKRPKPLTDMRYVVLEGVFRKNYPGYMGTSGGSITSIRRVEPWPIVPTQVGKP